MKKCYAILFALLFMFQLQAQNTPKEEYRAVWIATVNNIDFPIKPTTDANALKAEWLDLLERYKSLNFNALIVQIRPAGDAFYPTNYAPISRYLTGKEGTGLSPNFDLLQYMVTTAHERNMEFHAWLNPYRASMNLKLEDMAPTHQYRQHPEWFETYGGKFYFNPALPEVRQHITDVVTEVVRKYAVDAIHFDDYFYPYKSGGADFPDEADFQKYNTNYRTKAAWRRHNVDLLIEQCSKTIKTYKPWVRFGISPFGVWRNGAKDVRGSQSRAGVTAFDDLNAHILKWIKEGWIDYVTPQLYWHIGFEPADYEGLLYWWSEWRFARTMFPGHAVYKINTDKYDPWKNPEEMPKQIRLNRRTNGVSGSAFFSSSKLFNNPLGVLDSLTDLYKKPAKIPGMIWLNEPYTLAPMSLTFSPLDKGITINWENWPVAQSEPYYYIIYRFWGNEIGDYENINNIVAITPFGVQKQSWTDRTAVAGATYTYSISAVNKAHIESTPMEAVTIVRKKNKIKVKK